jgi:hypothetical protein
VRIVSLHAPQEWVTEQAAAAVKSGGTISAGSPAILWYLRFLTVPSGKYWARTSLREDRFLPNSFRFIIHQSFYATLVYCELQMVWYSKPQKELYNDDKTIIPSVEDSQLQPFRCTCYILTVGMSRLWVGGVGARSPPGARNFSLLSNVHTGSGAHPAFYTMDTGIVSLGWSGRGVKWTTHLHILLMLRMLEPYFYFPITLHGVVLNQLKPRITIHFFYLCLVSLICWQYS